MKKKLFFLMAGMIVALVSIEFFLSASYQIFQYRQDLYNQAKVKEEENQVRILAIGESTTAVAGNESDTLLVRYTAYPTQMETILNTRQSKYHFSVFNGGLMGGTTTRILDELERNITRYKPQIIVAMMGIKDTVPDIVNSQVAVVNPDQNQSKPTDHFQGSPPVHHRQKHHLVLQISGWLKSLKTYQFLDQLYAEVLTNSDLPDPVWVRSYQDIPTSFDERIHKEYIYRVHEPHLWNRPAKRLKITRALKLSLYYVLTGQYSAAEEVLLDMMSQHHFGYNLLAWIYQSQEKYDQAQDVWRAAMKQYPTEGIYAVMLAQMYINQGRLQEAEGLLREVLSSNDRYYFVDLHYDKSFLDQPVPVSGRYERNLLAYLEMGRLYKKKGQYQEAGDWLLKGFDLSIDQETENDFLQRLQRMALSAPKEEAYIDCLLELGELAYLQQDYADAETFLQAVVARNPIYYYPAFNILSKVYAAQGMSEKEQEVLQMMLKKHNVIGYYELSKFDKLRGKSAEEILESFQSLKPYMRETISNFHRLYKLTQQHNIKLFIMQYPTFGLDIFKAIGVDGGYDDIVYIDNEHIFDNAPPQKYFVSPRHPYKFSHYTKEGAYRLAENVADTILAIYRLN
jgi:tetratricopeptide (TPR) repeat protein